MGGILSYKCYVQESLDFEFKPPNGQRLGVGSPKHRVLDVGLLKRLVQLKELFISPFGAARLERSCLSLYARFLNL